jgi:hypothetical protein
MQLTSSDDIDRMRLALRALLDDTAAFVNDVGPYPVAGSIADCEQRNGGASKQTEAAYLQGNLLFESAADHVAALIRLLVAPVTTVAPWTCVRGGLEAAAIACWLMADSISPEERVSRSFAYRHEGLSQQVRLGRAIGDKPACEKTARRINEVEAKAKSLGYPEIVDRNGRRIGIGQQMPHMTSLVGSALGEEELYRILSAMAHGHSFALIRLGFFAPDAASPTFLKKGMNPDAAAMLIVTSADIVAKPLWARSVLLGHDTGRLKSLLLARYREIGLAESRHFWSNDRPS